MEKKDTKSAKKTISSEGDTVKKVSDSSKPVKKADGAKKTASAKAGKKKPSEKGAKKKKTPLRKSDKVILSIIAVLVALGAVFAGIILNLDFAEDIFHHGTDFIDDTHVDTDGDGR